MNVIVLLRARPSEEGRGRAAVSLLAPLRMTKCHHTPKAHTQRAESPAHTFSAWLRCELVRALTIFCAAKSQEGLFINPRKEEASFKRKGFRGNPAAWHIICFPCLRLPKDCAVSNAKTTITGKNHYRVRESILKRQGAFVSLPAAWLGVGGWIHLLQNFWISRLYVKVIGWISLTSFHVRSSGTLQCLVKHASKAKGKVYAEFS